MNAAYVVARGLTRVCPSVAVCVRATVSRVVQKSVCVWSVCARPGVRRRRARLWLKESMLFGKKKTVNTTFGYGFAHFAFDSLDVCSASCMRVLLLNSLLRDEAPFIFNFMAKVRRK